MNLTDILSSAHDHEVQIESDQIVQPDTSIPEVEPGFCVECGDQKADLHCTACEEDFCEVCSTVIHRVTFLRCNFFWARTDEGRLGGGGCIP